MQRPAAKYGRRRSSTTSSATTSRSRRSRPMARFLSGRQAASLASADTLWRWIPRPARKSGARTWCPRPANLAARRGPWMASSGRPVAPQCGSRAATTPKRTRRFGAPGTAGRGWATSVRATICMSPPPWRSTRPLGRSRGIYSTPRMSRSTGTRCRRPSSWTSGAVIARSKAPLMLPGTGICTSSIGPEDRCASSTASRTCIRTSSVPSIRRRGVPTSIPTGSPPPVRRPRFAQRGMEARTGPQSPTARARE